MGYQPSQQASLYLLLYMLSKGHLNLIGLISLPLTLVNGIIDRRDGFSLNIRLNSSAKARERFNLTVD
jgi:hypothetical protein